MRDVMLSQGCLSTLVERSLEGTGHFERNPATVERFASDLIELSTRHQFAYWLAGGEALSAVGRAALPVTQLKVSHGSRTE
jgi:hypothetical protein